MNNPQQERTIIRVKGPYRIINYELNPRPIFVSHSLFKRLMTTAGGRIPLAGVPAGIDLDLEVKLDASPHWRDKKAVDKVSDLATYPIKGLAAGIVFVEEAKCTFLFYGNCWWHLDQSLRNNEEVTEDEEGQNRFKKSIDQMEQGRTKMGEPFTRLPSSNFYRKTTEKKDGL